MTKSNVKYKTWTIHCSMQYKNKQTNKHAAAASESNRGVCVYTIRLILCVTVCECVCAVAITHVLLTLSALIPPPIQLTPLPHGAFHRQQEEEGSSSTFLLTQPLTLPLHHNSLPQSTECSQAATRC